MSGTSNAEAMLGKDITSCADNDTRIVLGLKHGQGDSLLPDGNRLYYERIVEYIKRTNLWKVRDDFTDAQAAEFLRKSMGVKKASEGKGFTSTSSWAFHGTAPKGGCLNRDDYNTKLIPEITEYKALCQKVARSSRSFFTVVRAQNQTTPVNGENQGDRLDYGRCKARSVSFDLTQDTVESLAFVQAAIKEMIKFESAREYVPVNVPGGQVYESRQMLREAIRAFAASKTAKTTSTMSVEEAWCVDWAQRLCDNDLTARIQNRHMTVLWYYLKSLYNDMHDEEKRDVSPESILKHIGFHKIKPTFTMCLMMERAKIRYHCSQQPWSIQHGSHWFSEVDLEEARENPTTENSFVRDQGTSTIEPWVVSFIEMEEFDLHILKEYLRPAKACWAS